MPDQTRPPAPKPALPIFLIAQRPDGFLRVRVLKPAENGQAAIARISADERYSRAWLAKAYQTAGAPA